MPGRDGKGPLGRGSMTGKGFGSCNRESTASRGQGLGRGQGARCRRGFRRNNAINQTVSKTQE